MHRQKILVALFLLTFSFGLFGCEQNQPENKLDNEKNTEENTDNNNSNNLITDKPSDDDNEYISENPTMFENETAGYDIAYVDGIDINESDPNNVEFTREDLNLTVTTLENPSEYDLITYISSNEHFPYYYQLASFQGRGETGKKLVFTGKGADELSPIYYYAQDDKVYKITATNDDAEVLEYIASTLKFR